MVLPGSFVEVIRRSVVTCDLKLIVLTETLRICTTISAKDMPSLI